MINVVMMVIGAGVLMGVLNGPANEAGEYASGMSNAIALALTGLFPESLGRYFSIIIDICGRRLLVFASVNDLSVFLKQVIIHVVCILTHILQIHHSL